MKHPPAGRVWMPTELLAVWSAVAPNGTTLQTYAVRHLGTLIHSSKHLPERTVEKACRAH